MKYLLLIIILFNFDSFTFSQNNDKIVNNISYTLYDAAPIDNVLSILGKNRSDLGYNPKSYWMTYPHHNQLLYTLPVFNDLFSEPDKIYTYVRQAASRVERWLIPDTIINNPQAIYKISHSLGIDRIYSGFRSYGANLDDRWFPKEKRGWETNSDTSILKSPVEYALEKTEKISIKYNLLNSSEAKQSWKEAKAEWRTFAKKLNSFEQRFYSYILLNLALANEQALRAYQFSDKNVLDRYFNFPKNSIDRFESEEYLRIRERILSEAGGFDMASLWYTALKTSELSGNIINLLTNNKDSIRPSEKTLKLYTPFGLFIMGSKNNDTYKQKENVLFLLEWGGNDVYNNAAVTNNKQMVSLYIDFKGNDIFKSGKDEKICSSSFGVSLLCDVNGDDIYDTEQESLGWSDMGFSALFDLNGDDSYYCRLRGIGASYNGIGMLADASGNDKYSLSSEGEGYGAFGGVGVLADAAGNDSYYSEPYASKSGLPGDYHSGGDIIANCSMGAGWGRRADMTDGHCYGGGIGFLIDLTGDDSYYAGNWNMGVGYWLGMGFLYDGRGNDTYSSCYFTQASGAHYAVGTMIDDGGNDKYVLWGDPKTVAGYGWAGAGLAFGWDYVIALLYNSGGNDFYEAKKIAIGSSEIRSNAFFIEIGGNDTYKLPENEIGMGSSDVREEYILPFNSHAKSFGMFIDTGGEDNYFNYDYNNNIETQSTIWKNNSEWRNPKDVKYECYGIGVDIP
jgi:hypothetical protein